MKAAIINSFEPSLKDLIKISKILEPIEIKLLIDKRFTLENSSKAHDY